MLQSDSRWCKSIIGSPLVNRTANASTYRSNLSSMDLHKRFSVPPCSVIVCHQLFTVFYRPIKMACLKLQVMLLDFFSDLDAVRLRPGFFLYGRCVYLATLRLMSRPLSKVHSCLLSASIALLWENFKSCRLDPKHVDSCTSAGIVFVFIQFNHLRKTGPPDAPLSFRISLFFFQGEIINSRKANWKASVVITIVRCISASYLSNGYGNT